MVEVSVVIPYLNEEQTIGIYIKKAFGEHNINEEVVASDNGSMDNSVKIAKSFGAKVVFQLKR